ncbi:type VII toxin-antitoxin system HepT family RNase toxin [Desulfofustis glycolicus]|uniref:Uncharacterized conserved protein YutE, UPF0331/DUF86 family n=1 Tax=Desulfofustis glycolicus DSM 9705 TaxID=1121409 RepID=A0A1M5XNH5_9BACT|nr:DUF86 domain-containing protein [Desulfofustis glycolicus]MCB2218622.1 DUF86 domain-containing protein [Desulfobulbaceae bacterium]SHI01316.1 Uncharacterized conserved protein YutE, UPF0331/DUF86 family [Desulfofustis glycolicus DSM 9705]
MSLNKDLLRTRCQEIIESCDRLDKIARLSKDAFLSDQDAKDIASYRLLLAIEGALNICYHICSKKLKKVPENYADCFRLLGESALIPPDLADKLQKMARFRNLLVHVYWEVDEDLIYTILLSHVQDLREFVGKVAYLG